MFRTIFLSILFTAAFAEFIELPTCASDIGEVENATVSGATVVNGKFILKRGTTVGITIDFHASTTVKSVITSVHGIMNSIPIPFPLPNSDECANSDSGITCPLEAGEIYTYQRMLPVSHLYPPVQVKVKWELLNELSEVIVCVLIPAKIT